MRLKLFALMLLTICTFTGCYMPLTGRVIDAETQQPIDGAVVLVEWNEAHGLGLTYHTVYKIAETETDKKGRFSLPGAYSPFIDQPYLVIYKQGYVAWRNDNVFPGYEKRKDYDVWQHGYVYKLERFKDGYSRDKHSMFMDTGIIGSDMRKTPRYYTGLMYESKAGTEEVERKKRDKIRSDK